MPKELCENSSVKGFNKAGDFVFSGFIKSEFVQHQLVILVRSSSSLAFASDLSCTEKDKKILLSSTNDSRPLFTTAVGR
jgi:hypothetical protein